MLHTHWEAPSAAFGCHARRNFFPGRSAELGLAGRQHVMNRRADRLADGAARMCPDREAHFGQVAVVTSPEMTVTEAGGWPDAPVASAVRSSSKLANDSLNAAHAGSAPRSVRSACPRPRAAHGLVPRFQAVQATGQQQRQRQRHGQNPVVPVAGDRFGARCPASELTCNIQEVGGAPHIPANPGFSPTGHRP